MNLFIGNSVIPIYFQEKSPFPNILIISLKRRFKYLKGANLYDIEDLQNLLGIGRTRAYQLVKEAYEKQQPFKVIKLGKLYRIPKKPFDDWMEGNT